MAGGTDKDKDKPMRTALSTVVEAVRAGYGTQRADPHSLPDSGHDPEFLERTAPMLEFLYSRYFRVRTIGMENVPVEGPALIVANHSGGIPYDGAMLIYSIYRDHPRHRRLRTLVANFAFRSHWLMNVIARIGGVRASTETALPLLARGELVGVFPEGLKGVGKMFRERYRLDRFGRGGFVRLARKAQVPIIPVAIVGAEEIHPIVGKITTLAEPLGIPYIPITPTFPLLGPLGLLPVPTKWTIRFGEPIPCPGPASPAPTNGASPAVDPPEAADDAETSRTAEQVRQSIDGMIAELLAQRRSIIFG
jgi:1-acyl-sn-glycerol-3-phosphate acyltransferase